MKIKEIMHTIKELAKSQGFYGRLYDELLRVQAEEPSEWADTVNALESYNFSTPIDLIMYLEG